jgi:hypothetical protein
VEKENCIMALPRLNDSPNYNLVIPSLKQNVKFRPFLVKEEKVLLMALESEDQNQILNTVIDTIKTCVTEDIDSTKLTTFDIEYMFLKIRAKSVGETSNITMKCNECESENDISLNIDSIEIEVPDISNVIELDDQISIEMGWPTFNDVIHNDILSSESNVDQIFGLIRSSIVAIRTAEERFSAKDQTVKEMDTFIESMNNKQFAKVREYVEKMPRLKHDVTFDCKKCNHKNHTEIEGMQNFFS